MQYKEWSFEHCFESKSAYGRPLVLYTDPKGKKANIKKRRLKFVVLL